MIREDVLFQASKYIVQDLLYLNEMRDGRRKEKFFTSNFLEGLIYDAIDDVVRENGSKLNRNNRVSYITEHALEIIQQKLPLPLVVEHVVCKNIYFAFLKEMLQQGTLTEEKVFNLLDQFYHLALITKEQDLQLDAAGLRTRMVTSGEWDLTDPFIRYRTIQLKLVPNPFYLFNFEKGGIL